MSPNAPDIKKLKNKNYVKNLYILKNSEDSDKIIKHIETVQKDITKTSLSNGLYTICLSNDPEKIDCFLKQIADKTPNVKRSLFEYQRELNVTYDTLFFISTCLPKPIQRKLKYMINTKLLQAFSLTNQ